MNDETILAVAKEVTNIDIELLYAIHNYFVIEKNDFDVPVEISDIMAIEALYSFLNNKHCSKVVQTTNNIYFYYGVATGEVIPVLVPRNGDTIFCEF